MNVIGQVQKPDDVSVSVTLALTLEEWKKVASDLATGQAYVSEDLNRELRALIQKFEQTFYVNDADREAVK